VARVEIDMRASFGWQNGYVSLAATLNNNNPASATGGTVEPEYQYQPDIPPPGQAPLFPDSEFLPLHGVPDVDAVLTDEEAFGPADTTY
jgi:hypothetical protein